MSEFTQPGKRELDIGKYLSEAWALTIDSRFIGLHLLVGLVTGLILLVAGLTVVGCLLVYFPIFCGLFLITRNRMQDQPTELGDLFKGFEVFLEGLIASLILLLVLIVLVPIVVGIYLIFWCCLPVPIVATLIVSAFLLTYAIGLIPGLLYERRMKAIDAIKINFAFATANLGQLLLFNLVIAAGLGLGATLALLGLLFAIPFAAFSYTILYRELVGFGEEA